MIGSRVEENLPNKEVEGKITTTELPKTVATENGAHHDHESYPIVLVDFTRVQTPLIIGIWILSASIAKIGKALLTYGSHASASKYILF